MEGFERLCGAQTLTSSPYGIRMAEFLTATFSLRLQNMQTIKNSVGVKFIDGSNRIVNRNWLKPNSKKGLICAWPPQGTWLKDEEIDENIQRGAVLSGSG